MNRLPSFRLPGFDFGLNPNLPSSINSQSSTGGYVVITPVRNEGLYLQKTIDSVVSQTLLPRKWIVVNDGSTDNTGQTH